MDPDPEVLVHRMFEQAYANSKMSNTFSPPFVSVKNITLHTIIKHYSSREVGLPMDTYNQLSAFLIIKMVMDTAQFKNGPQNV